MKRKIVVLGGGISGYGSAILAKKKGFDTFLTDMGKIAPKFRERLDEWGVEYEEGQHTEERILDANEVIKSPGIPDTAPIVMKIRERGIPVISEIEFAGRYKGVAKTICITGYIACKFLNFNSLSRQSNIKSQRTVNNATRNLASVAHLCNHSSLNTSRHSL